MRYLIPILFLVMAGYKVTAQCDFDLNLPITSNADFFAHCNVNGVVANDLSLPAQGVCGVTLHFEHEFIGNLQIELISPAGQSIVLTGPQTNSNFTNGTEWNVDFVPCSSVPIPDSGFPNTWNNVAPWSIGADYSGSYHPFFGCLEDFNTGPVNGIWQVHILNGPFYTGQLIGFSLEFCDPVGIICEPCTPKSGIFVDSVAEFCQNDVSLVNFNPMLIFPDGLANPVLYTHQWVLVSGGIILQIDDDIAWENLLPGSYEIYAVSFLNSFLDQIQGYIGQSFASLVNATLSGNFCLDISDNAVQLNINPEYNESPRDVNICKGDTFYLDGIPYTSSGLISANLSSQHGCDSIVNINLQVNGAEFFITHDTISCLNTSTLLDTAQFKLLSPNAQIIQFEWRDASGTVLTNNPSVTVTTGGMYHFSVVVLTGSFLCTIDTSIQVIEQNDVPDEPVLISGTPCVGTSTFFYVAPDSLRAFLVWNVEGNPQLIEKPDSVYVNWDTPGMYNVCVYSVNQCGISNTVCHEVVVGNAPVFDIQYDSITCNGNIAVNVTGSNVDLTWSVLHGDINLIQNINGSNVQGTINAGMEGTLSYFGQVGGCDIFGNLDIDILAPTEIIGLSDTIFCDTAFLSFDLGISNGIHGTVFYTWKGVHDSLDLAPGPISIAISTGVSDYFVIDSIQTELKGCSVLLPDTIRIDIQPSPFATFADTIVLCNSFSQSGLPIFRLTDLITGGDKSGNWNISLIPGAYFKNDSLDVQFVPPGNYFLIYNIPGINGNCAEKFYQVPVSIEKCSCPIPAGNLIFNVCDDQTFVDLDVAFVPEVPVVYYWLEALGQKILIPGNIIQVSDLTPGQNALLIESLGPWAGMCADTVVVSINLYEAQEAGLDRAFSYCMETGSMVQLDTLLSGAVPGGVWVAEPADFPNLTQSYNPANHLLDLSKLGSGQLKMKYIVIGAGNCGADTATITFDVQPVPKLKIGGNTQLNCLTGTTTLSAETEHGMDANYLWLSEGAVLSTGILPDSITVNAAGHYVLIAESTTSGCRDTLEITINEATSLIVEANIRTSHQCGDEFVTVIVSDVVGGAPPYNYSLDGVAYSEYPRFNEVMPGTYLMHIKDQFDCIYTQPLQIEVNRAVFFDLGPNRNIKLGDSVHLVVNFDQGQISTLQLFANGIEQFVVDGKVILVPETTTTVSTKIVDINGCIYEDFLTIFVDHNFDIFVPNAFTPNGDGNNDHFYVPHNPSIKEIVAFDIYDRWGNHLFGVKNKLSGEASFSWDGTFQGRLMNPAIFVYKIKYTSFQNELYEKYGTFALIR